MRKILVVDDDLDLRRSVRTALSDHFEVDEAQDGIEAMERLHLSGADLVILDMDMPRMGGMETLRAIKKFDPKILVLVLTAYSSVPDAVDAIREGAYNYVAKPVRHADLQRMVERALEANEMVAQFAISAPILRDASGAELSSRSGEMHKVFEMVQRLAKVDTAVLLRGESGTGKEVVARAIHYNSLRKDGKFVAVNLSAVPETLMESELFGHEKGAFTGADQRQIGKFQFADSGTLFLDEIGDISLAMQVKLLRVLQEKRFMPVGSNREIEANVRIVAATNRNLEEMMKTGQFREDLYYRLSVLPIFLPPLRDRKEDLEMLIAHFVKKFNRLHGRRIQGVDSDALARLKSYAWPGNIRELENVIEHAFVLASDDVIAEAFLPPNLRPKVMEVISGRGETVPPNEASGPGASLPPELSDGDLDFQVHKERFEKEFIIRALTRFRGRINQTSQFTNISKKTLLRKMEKYNLKTEDFRK